MVRLVLIFLIITLPSCTFQKPSSLTVTCIDVGQGDSLLISFPNGEHWLVDAGGVPAGDTESGVDPGHRNVLSVLRAKAIQSLDVVVMTHPDEDHVQGMLAVARHVPVSQVYWNGFEGSRTEKKVRKEFTQRGTRMNVVKAGDVTRVGDVGVSVLSPPAEPILGTRSPENENSVIMLIRYGTKSILLTGDVEEAGERKLLATFGLEIRNVSLLKVAHHGSDSSSMSDFVRRTRPGIAFVSCGKRNRYGHPSGDVIKRLERVGADVYRTDQCGMLEWMTDGRSEAVATMLPCNKNALREAQGVTN